MLQLGEISFCEKTDYNIKTQQMKEKLMNKLEKHYDVKIVRKHFDKFNDHSIDKINNFPYSVCLKTNGNPYLLFLTRINGINQILFVDKKIQSQYFLPRMILSAFKFADELFAGTVIDGEMVKPLESHLSKNGNNGEDIDKRWIYIIHDIYLYKGERLNKYNLSQRINMIYNLLDKEYTDDIYDNCRLEVKKYVPCSKLDMLVHEYMPKLPYTCRGIYFKPLYITYMDILYNFNDSLIKDTTRVKYQKEDNIMHANDIHQLKKQLVRDNTNKDTRDGQSTTLAPSLKLYSLSASPRDSRDSSPMSDDTVHSNEGISDKTEAQYYIEKTNIVDLYFMYDMNGTKLGYAGVPYARTSRLLQTTFENMKFNARIMFNCVYSAKFKKWVPISAST
jgi:hypothetical protein